MTESINAYDMLARESPSELFHEASKLRESDTSMARAVWTVNSSALIRQAISQPAASLEGYPSIALPTKPEGLDASIFDVLLRRRSERTFTGEALTTAELSSLLYYAAAVTTRTTDAGGATWGLRCAPSGGALFPIDTYCASFAVADVPQGLYAYNPQSHALELVADGSFAEALGAATYLADTFTAGSACILLAANFSRTKFKYGERGYRFVLLEAGHIAQNILLVAEALGVGAVALGGFVDDQVNAMVGVDGCDRAVVYALIVGRAVVQPD